MDRPRTDANGVRRVLKQRHQLFVSLLCTVDALVIAIACYGAWVVRRFFIEGSLPAITLTGGRNVWLREPLIIFAIPLALVSMWFLGLYQPRRDRTLHNELRQIFKAAIVTSIAVIVALWAVGGNLFGGWRDGPAVSVWGIHIDAARVQIISLTILMILGLGLERAVFRSILRSLRRRGWNLRHVCIIGTGRLARVCCSTLDRNSWTGIHVAYFISHLDQTGEKSSCMGRPVLGGLAQLEQVLESNPPDAVYLAIPTSRTAVRPTLLRRLERFPVSVRMIPDVHPRHMTQTMTLSELDGMPVLSVRESPLTGVGGLVKRLIDIGGSLLAIALFSPIMGATALLVRSSSPGPIIFRQRRVSLGGEGFNIFKFRTMYHAEDEIAPARWTSRDDPRVTPVGRFLRRTSLDELPQLFNVLRGDMSLVGPRPERPELISRFRDDWRGYMLRQHVKAGITGWAQVNGLRGDTSLRKRLQFDLFYIRHWSLGFDLKIIWLTLFRGFVHRNAH